MLCLEPHEVLQGGGEIPGDAIPRDSDGGGSLKHEGGREDRLACVCVSLAEPVVLMVSLLVMGLIVGLPRGWFRKLEKGAGTKRE